MKGLLVIFCSLFNYITLFVSRYRIRQKELALRTVCGASGYSLLKMLSVEFLLILLFATVIACFLILSVHQPFISLSNISMNLSAIYREFIMCIGSVIFVSLLTFLVLLFSFNVQQSMFQFVGLTQTCSVKSLSLSNC